MNWQLEAGVRNAWLLTVPLIAVSVVLGLLRPQVARRMADMTGYPPADRAITIAASIVPYPFFVATVWTPLASVGPLLIAGLLIYALGLAVFVAAVVSFTAAPAGVLIERGPYRWSRNPIYVANAIACVGICVATLHLLLTGWLLLLLVLQHFMIKAEERWCSVQFGAAYQDYLQRVPRYLGVR